MKDEFNLSWVSVLDEYMMECLNKYCPGFMCVGLKPHPFGNERHTISCALTSILFRDLIVEGKDRPKELGQKKVQQDWSNSWADAADMRDVVWYQESSSDV